MFLEIMVLIFFILLVQIIILAFMMRQIKSLWSEATQSQARFDIELRKTYNLISKNTTDLQQNGFYNKEIEKYNNLRIKEINVEEKRELFLLLKDIVIEIDSNPDNLSYIKDTFEKLQNARRSYNSKVLLFNHRVSNFPNVIFAKLLKFHKKDYFG